MVRFIALAKNENSNDNYLYNLAVGNWVLTYIIEWLASCSQAG